MRRYSSLILFALAGLASAQTTWDRSQFASEQIERYRAHYDVPGISVAIATNGKIIFAKGFGFADVERKIPVQTTDYFRLASVSKPITSTMIFELVEQGKLNLDWPVRQVLPELPAHHIYRIRDLLCHQSGVRHYGNEPPLKNYPTSFSALDRFVKDPLLFTPGEKYSYSTHGFTVLGAVIEKIVKKPYRIYAAERLRAWGIHGVACETGSNPNRTKIYDRSQDKNKLVGRDDLSWKYPGGGYEATAIGMCNLGSAVESGKILKRETLEQMWTIQKPKSGDSTMALGWSISNDVGHKAAVHGGSQLGANSSWRIQIDEHTVIMVLSNRDGHKPGDLALYLSRLIRLAPNAPLPEMKLG
jgi:CubicO group peptidase (beta-lactamase class C family)